MLNTSFCYICVVLTAVLVAASTAGVGSFSAPPDRPYASSDTDSAAVRSLDRAHSSAAAENAVILRSGRKLTRTDVYGAEDVDFSVRFDEYVIPYSVFGVYVMPGEEVDLEAVLARVGGTYHAEASAGTISAVDSAKWQWTAPQKTGQYTIEVANTAAQSSVTLNVFVLTPFRPSNRELNGYRIGKYEEVPLRGNEVYRAPPGFVELRPANSDVKVSPHFTLGQFAAKQKSDYPKYLLLREPLLLKLEMLLSELKKRGVRANSLHIMSGYRTPHYNRAIGNTTNYSRHLYGGAADVFVDADHDLYMDDLTGDGRVDIEDARFLAEIVEHHAGQDWYDSLSGGLGVYAKNAVRGPFIHIDVRGRRVRW